MPTLAENRFLYFFALGVPCLATDTIHVFRRRNGILASVLEEGAFEAGDPGSSTL